MTQTETQDAYQTKADDLVSDATIAVQVLLGDTPGDLEFVPLRPQMASERFLTDLTSRWPGRGLRSVGVIGMRGMQPLIALKEVLSTEQVDAISEEFIAYVSKMIRAELEVTKTATLCKMYYH